MPIDARTLSGAELPLRRHSWSADDVILYGLGLGAGVPATSPDELAYVYESGLKVLPSFGVLAPSLSLFDLFGRDDFDVPLAKVLHGEQSLTVHRPIPVQADAEVSARIAGVYDTGKHALVVLETTTTLDGEDDPIASTRLGLFVRGEGGFGGERGPAAPAAPPEREPDHRVEVSTLEQQALIYRLSGDRNPLHADPAFAERAGFDRPILHGLCTYGVVAKAAVQAALGGDVTRMTSYSARFSGVVVPGETLAVSIWEDGEQLMLAADIDARQARVLSGSVLTAASAPTARESAGVA